jgi:DNA-binding response OmpR family regulator
MLASAMFDLGGAGDTNEEACAPRVSGMRRVARVFVLARAVAAASALTEILRDAGYMVATCSDPDDANPAVARFSPHLLLVDLDDVEPLHGLAVPAPSALGVSTRPPIVGMTFDVSGADPAVVALLQKPIDASELLTTIRRVVGERLTLLDRVARAV